MKKLLAILVLSTIFISCDFGNKTNSDNTEKTATVQIENKDSHKEDNGSSGSPSESINTQKAEERPAPVIGSLSGIIESKITESETIESTLDNQEKITSSENNDGTNIHSSNIYNKVIDVISNSNSGTIEILFSKNLALDFEPTAYIKITPDIEYETSRLNNKIIIRGEFDLEEEYDITILKDVRAIDNSKLEKDKIDKIVFKPLEPKIMFSNEGILLPSTSNKNILFRSMNVNKVKISVIKVYKNNMTQFLQNFLFKGNGTVSNTTYYNSMSNVGEEIFTSEYYIDNEKNKWVQSSIDLNNVIDNNGVYLLRVSFDESGISYVFDEEISSWEKDRLFRNNANISKGIILSDISMIAQVDNKAIAVKVMDILENTPKENVTVKLISINNQLIAEKTTDNAGDILFDLSPEGYYLLCETDESTSILILNNPLARDGFEVDGVYSIDGINAFIYTERGVYRPGEPVHLSIIARNNNMPLPDDHPVSINIYTPRGSKYVENDLIQEGKDGFYTYTFNTDTADETGIWTLEAIIGSRKINKAISIETVVPYKIRAEIKADSEIKINDEDNEIKLAIESQYLFGASGSNLQYEVYWHATENYPYFEKYKNYSFRNNSQYNYYINGYIDGSLDEDGKSDITISLEDLEFRSVNLIMTLNGQVLEDSGRPVLTREYVNLNRFDSYIGIESTDYYIKTGEPLGIRVITPSIDGEKLISGRELIYRIYENSYSWWWDYSSYDDFIRSMKGDSHTTLIAEKEFISTEIPYIINDIIDKYGYIFIEVEDIHTGQVTSVNLFSTEWADPSTIKKVETLNITTDKKSYQVGEKAQLSFNGVDGAKALIAIEQNGEIVRRYLTEVSSGIVTETIDINEKMTPTTYVHIMLLQDYNQKENDRPLRLYGTVPIKIEDENTKLNINIEAPESIRPNEKFKVAISNDKERKMNYTVAVVDEGLLDITMFSTPDPWKYFYQKLASTLSIYDNYSEIMDKPYGQIHQILKVGGDYSAADMAERRRRQRDLGFDDADRFKPVSLFQGVLTTDENGNAEVEFEMPNYMGSVRIMVIGAADNAYSSAEKEMFVRAPVVVQQDLPRTLKVGDRFSFPVNVFALEDNIGEIEVAYSFRGRTQSQKLTLAKDEKKTIYFTDAVDPVVGTDRIVITAKSDVYNYEESIGMAINSNSVPLYISKDAILKTDESIDFVQEQDYIKGSVDSVVTVSSRPLLGLDHQLQYLIRYPYGCIEQTTSAAFPQMFLDRVMTKQNYNKELALQNVNGAILRLSMFQLPNGSFSYWPGQRETYDWATNYAGHFLILARKNGYYVPDTMYNNMMNYLDRMIREDGFWEDGRDNVRIYSLYLLALAGSPNFSEMNYIQTNYIGYIREQSKMYLAAAYKLAGDIKSARDIVKSVDKDKMFGDESNYRYTYGSRQREMAIYLDCYYTVFENIDEEVYTILVETLRSNRWFSTQTLAYSMVSLANIFQNNEDKPVKITVDIDGVIEEYDGQTQQYVSVPENAQNIKITSNNENNIYVNYFWEGSPINSTIEDYSDILNISRNFYDRNGNLIETPTTVNTGDSFWMEVIVGSEGNSVYVDNVAINQILPTGWEIENLRVTDSEYPQWIQEIIARKGTRVAYEDIRDDRIMWFFDYYTNYDDDFDGHSFFVKINAVTKGTFTFPGTRVEAMYDNNYKAYLGGFRVEVE